MGKKAPSRRWGPLEIAIAMVVLAGGAAALMMSNFGGEVGSSRQASAHPQFFAPAAVSAGNSVAPGGRMLVVADAPAPQLAAVVTVAAPAQAPAPVPEAAPAKPWIKHISGSLPDVAIEGPASSHSSASAGTTDAATAPTASSPDVAATPGATTTAPRAAPKYVHYGETTRSSIMGNAAGPVYNFTGKQ